jgi:hypothetical protein
MEIRIFLDQVEPPAGRLWLVRSPQWDPDTQQGEEVAFMGWLGMLRALYELVESPHARSSATEQDR